MRAVTRRNTEGGPAEVARLSSQLLAFLVFTDLGLFKAILDSSKLN